MFMRTKLGLSQLRAWGSFIVSHARVYNEIERRMAQTEGVLPYHWYDVLFVLNTSKEKRMRMSELANLIVTSKSALTRSVDKMIDEGLMKKVRCKADGRVLYATMTPKGHVALKKSWPFYRACVHELFGQHLSSEEARELQRILMKLGRYQNKRPQNAKGA
jgi:DNA-binding MarR family transcriptional regulator